jgi:hypothetical protein
MSENNSADFSQKKASDELRQESAARNESDPKPAKKELLDVYIGAVEKGPKAARRFNDLVAKTLKLEP